MNPRATLANALWYASNLPVWHSYRRALAHPRAAQERVFRGYMRQAGQTAFGREHGLTADCSYESFCQRVPLRAYEELEPWIERIRRGESGVLTPQPVRRLATTSGTTGGRKLIPHTRPLQAEFNRAIGPWIVDLFHAHPVLLGGRAYWSISPVARGPEPQASAVPIGFEDDSEYLGGVRRRLVDAVMAVPSHVRFAEGVDAWRQETVRHLQATPDLRLISIWHGSFLDLLLHGQERPRQWWPRLRLISCWADGHAAGAAASLAAQYPGIVVQPKGLLATEGVVSIPFADRFPLAVRSHFLEFIDERQHVWRAHELVNGQTYEVVLTTAGGLYRYRLGDLVRVDGFVRRTPSIRFLGKSGQTSDRFGEKLAEPFVAAILSRLSARAPTPFRFAMLAPDGPQYRLFVEGAIVPTLGDELDQALRANPHYAYCRDLGQLGPCAVTHVRHGHVAFLRRMMRLGQRPGDVKPVALSGLDGWDAAFDAANEDEPGEPGL